MAGNNWITFTSRINKELEMRVENELASMDNYDNIEDATRVKHYLMSKYKEENLMHQKKLLMETFDNQNFYAQCKEEWIQNMIRDGKKIYEKSLLPQEEKCKNYHFLTFNFPEDMNTKTRIYLIQIILNELPIENDNFEGAFEQRGEEQWEEKSLHFHCIVRAKAGNYKQQLLKPLKNICKDFNTQYGYNISPAIMDHQPIKNKSTLDVKKEYIRGRKKPDKMTKALNDKPFRDALGLQELYTYSEVLTIPASPQAVILTSPKNDGKRSYNKSYNGDVIVNNQKTTLSFN